MYKKLLIALIICVLCLSPIAAENWDSFAGDVDHSAYRDGESGFVTNLWTFNMESPVHCSPAIYKDYIYVVSDDGMLKAINMEKGHEEWKLDLKSKTNSSPIVHSNRLYIGCEDGIKAVNINTHKVSWEYDCNDVQSTPFFYDDVVYFGCDDGHLYGLDKDNGKVVLNKKLDGKFKSSPIVVNDSIYIGSNNGKLYSVGTDKEKNWDYTTGDEILSSPSYVNETIIFGSTDGNLYCLNESDGALNWKVDLNNKIISSPTIDENDNSVFVGSDEGNLTCIDTRDGTVNKYTGLEEFTYNPGTFLFNSKITSSPAINGNSLFFGDDSGNVYSLNIEKYEVPGSMQLYYSIGVLIVVLIVAVVVVKKLKK